DLSLWAGREAWRQLHANNGGLRRGDVRHGRAGAGDGLVGPARASGLEANALLSVRWHVWRGCGHALYADLGRPDATDLSVGLRRGQYPARAHGPGPAKALGGQVGRRNGRRLRWRLVLAVEPLRPRREVRHHDVHPG